MPRPNSPKRAALANLIKKHLPLFLVVVSAVCAAAPLTCLGEEIPKIAWHRPLGQPLDRPGVRKNNVDIDDGYWQGAPVGGFGAGTFSRTYRGDFARWHIKAESLHPYMGCCREILAPRQRIVGSIRASFTNVRERSNEIKLCLAQMLGEGQPSSDEHEDAWERSLPKIHSLRADLERRQTSRWRRWVALSRGNGTELSYVAESPNQKVQL